MKIKTNVLTKLVNKAYKCSTNNDAISLTMLMNIKCENNLLTITTSNDYGDYFFVSDEVDTDDFYVTLYGEQFTKLLNKLSSDYVELLVEDGVLLIKANGTYKLSLPFDENGDIITYPNPLKDRDITYDTEIKLSDVMKIKSINTSALAKTDEVPIYTNYYVGDKVVTTDSNKLCLLDLKLFDKPVMLSVATLDLMCEMPDDINVKFIDDELICVSGNCILYTHIADDADDFDIETMMELCDIKVDNTCKIYKSQLLDTLDRLNLFADVYKKLRALELRFNKSYIEIASLQSNAVERIDYVDDKEHPEFSCKINADMLMSQIKVIPSEIITVEYGSDAILKLVNNDVLQILALLND